MKPLSRRDFLKVGSLAFLGTAGATALTQNNHDHIHAEETPHASSYLTRDAARRSWRPARHSR